MEKINSIVVPVDFLNSADKLVKYATYMAGELSAKIHFIHVVELYSGDAMLGAPYTHEYREMFLSDAKLRMDNLIADYKEQIPGCTGEVVFGDPVDKIVEYAKEKHADLIIISTHGAKGLEKILLGSVAERVLKRAHCPVLIMNPFKK
jgi:nucleotide-binding universal stress UspA family protein